MGWNDWNPEPDPEENSLRWRLEVAVAALLTGVGLYLAAESIWSMALMLAN